MTKPIVIAVDGEPLGVVVANGAQGNFRFMAVKLSVFPLEGKVFSSAAEARQAARDVLAQAAAPDAGRGRNDGREIGDLVA